MFIGRERELKRLNAMYQSDKLEVAIIYGRRRVGKTTLINEFCKDKKTIFFAAMENSAEMNLEALSGAIMEMEAEAVYASHSARESSPLRTETQRATGQGASVANVIFRSFSDALIKIQEMASRERLVFVIDEYPYLAKAEPSISSILQNFLDHQFKETRLFLILCGSSMSFMENQVLGYQSPLYGRRTAQFKILPFDYRDTGRWFPAYSYEEKAMMYGITGGIPLYLEQFSPECSIQENLLNGVFNNNSMLFEEPSNLLKQALREPATYNSIITAIASGKSKLSEIATTVGMESGLCSKFVENLMTLGIVKRETPVTARSSKRPIYELEDLFFRFWYTFVPRNMAAIVSGRFERIYASAVGNRLSDYMGRVFEKMCRDYLLYYDDQLPFQPQDIGQWWGGNPKTHQQAQIDVVAISEEEQSAIIGSCKFRNEPLPVSEWERMKEYSRAMGGFARCYYYLFSKSGFTENLRQKQDGVNLRLIGMEELYGSCVSEEYDEKHPD
ncbi:MAG: ATP-binding protein [Lachnospiraceae bacterium]|nr:ATP-binding protein [Lachnospiraceae bacterium]